MVIWFWPCGQPQSVSAAQLIFDGANTRSPLLLSNPLLTGRGEQGNRHHKYKDGILLMFVVAFSFLMQRHVVGL